MKTQLGIDLRKQAEGMIAQGEAQIAAGRKLFEAADIIESNPSAVQESRPIVRTILRPRVTHKNAMMAILEEAKKPLTRNDIFEALNAGGHKISMISLSSILSRMKKGGLIKAKPHSKWTLAAQEAGQQPQKTEV